MREQKTFPYIFFKPIMIGAILIAVVFFTADIWQSRAFEQVQSKAVLAGQTKDLSGNIYNMKGKSLIKEIDNGLLLTRWIFILLMVFSFFFLVVIFLLHGKRNLRLKNKRNELQMTALSAQISPNFIFSCLTAINRFILISSAREASSYLSKFAKLMRLMLDNSKSNFVLLHQEISSLTLYLELEALRFNYTFSYRIEVAENIDPASISITPMIIQPYLENSVWHGMQNQLNAGMIIVRFDNSNSNYLRCEIEDNGIGRKRSSEIARLDNNNQNKIKGMNLNENRLGLLAKAGFHKTSYKVIDLKNLDGTGIGTRIILNIPYLKK